MSAWAVVGLMIVGGGLMACQAPINAALRTHVDVFGSALVSFTIGTAALLLVVLACGKANLAGLRNVAWWHLTGGLIGAVFVTVTLLAAPRIGVTAMIVAALAGQMAMAMVIDRFGWMGMAVREVTLPRVLGVLLLGAAVWLINWRR
jgi:transporter family-2 protein